MKIYQLDRKNISQKKKISAIAREHQPKKENIRRNAGISAEKGKYQP